jgi:hypothetical protein
MYQRGFHWTHFREILCWGLLTKICQENPDLVTIAQKLGTLHEDPSTVSVLPATNIRKKALFPIIGNDMYLNNAQRMHCCLSIAKRVTGTSKYVTL